MLNDPKPNYIASFDGLRAIAVTIVIIYHLETRLFTGGYVGVDVFFVLSGFLITGILVTEFERSRGIRLGRFYVKRLMRLGPALLAMLALFCIVSLVFLSPGQAHANYREAAVAGAYMTNWARALPLGSSVYLGHTWSLSIEEQFYLLWPPILLAMLKAGCARQRIALVAVAIALAAWALRIYFMAVQANLGRATNGLDTRADALMVGCALALMMGSTSRPAVINASLLKHASIAAPVGCLVIMGMALLTTPHDEAMVSFGLAGVEVLSAVIVFDLLGNRSSALSRLLQLPWLTWIGRLSYAFYLYHYPVFLAIKNMGYGPRTMAVIGGPATLVLTVLSYYFLEQPVLRWYRRRDEAQRIVARSAHPAFETWET